MVGKNLVGRTQYVCYGREQMVINRVKRSKDSAQTGIQVCRLGYCKLPCFRGLGTRAAHTLTRIEKDMPQVASCAPANSFILGKLSAEKLSLKI
jgi:hypothetical protein